MKKLKCKKCDASKPISEFYERKYDGVIKYHQTCKVCEREYSRAYNKKHSRKGQLKRSSNEFVVGGFVCF